jgi:hypothetical protein
MYAVQRIEWSSRCVMCGGGGYVNVKFGGGSFDADVTPFVVIFGLDMYFVHLVCRYWCRE